jgi:hypothetical protein
MSQPCRWWWFGRLTFSFVLGFSLFVFSLNSDCFHIGPLLIYKRILWIPALMQKSDALPFRMTSNVLIVGLLCIFGQLPSNRCDIVPLDSGITPISYDVDLILRLPGPTDPLGRRMFASPAMQWLQCF